MSESSPGRPVDRERSIVTAASESTDRSGPAADLESCIVPLQTALRMQPRQLAGILERTARHAVIPRLPVDFDGRYDRTVPARVRVRREPIARDTERYRAALDDATRARYRDGASAAATGTVTFLGQSIDFEGPVPDWDHDRLTELPLLWRLKLQAFEPLEWLVLGYGRPDASDGLDERFDRWICDWAGSNPVGTRQYLRRSWIPHAVSLRLLNWCRYAVWAGHDGSTAAGRTLYHEIYKNAAFLANHVEWDVGGNHLIENAAALVVAGVLFDDHETGWIETGLDVLEHATETQFLDDGGHFERSPMYHVMTVSRYLTAASVLTEAGRDVPRFIEETAANGVAFLDALEPPNGRIPLLNDAVYEEVETIQTLRSYAAAAGIDPGSDRSQTPVEGSRAPTASGYYWLEAGDARVLVDGGPVGPRHLPGHSHNDQLQFCLWVDETPMIVDTGTYEYAPTVRRRYSRSVRAHNTVQVGESEPIALAGQYAMGARAAPTVRRYEPTEPARFEGRFRAPGGLRDVVGSVPGVKADRTGGYTHRRTIVAADAHVLVTDTVDETPFTSRLHFHPTVTVREIEPGTYVATDDTARTQLFVSVLTTDAASRAVASEYYPAFGVREQRTTLEFEVEHGRTCRYVLRTDGELPAEDRIEPLRTESRRR
ncbi:alginate lyase family protein [Natrarchaeobaculum aegyptiacum]|uniref:Uncharacterized protein n=1 Tax=Natrarchaeobaculum aegyptiacum TaxID=745377 RepID=A0A2Z2I0Z9_9EURY|nr:alginate lyase family protein [Natrarchaeobaculum aegyptiacum]ARS89978.1 hypothetical protein B1756_09710 [Natrarchaeobaculum aegyptiacum]